MIQGKIVNIHFLLRRLITVAVVIAVTGAGAATLKNVESTQAATDKAAAASQKRINDVLSQTDDAVNKYVQALADTESLNKYNAHLGEQVKAQQTEIASLQKQLNDIETTSREVQPLMQKMVDTLAQFVSLDVPFLLDERTARVKRLQDMLTRPEVSISEKYRRILEAYQIELEYGRTLDAYEGKIGSGATAKTVEFVRLGRIALLYQTPDGKETGYWDKDKKTWVEDDSYARSVKEALRIAKKQGAPDLLTVPVHAPEEDKS